MDKNKKTQVDISEKNKQHCNTEKHQQKECECKHDGCGCNEHCECKNKAEQENKEAIYLEALQRTMAEFDNYRKRMAMSNEKSKLDGICQTITAILPSVDAVDKAMEMCKGNVQVLEGLKLIKENILTAFKNLGLKEIEAVNKPFDPNYHNAVVATEEKGVEPGIVLEEYQKGYQFGDKVVRYTMCRVSK